MHIAAMFVCKLCCLWLRLTCCTLARVQNADVMDYVTCWSFHLFKKLFQHFCKKLNPIVSQFGLPNVNLKSNKSIFLATDFEICNGQRDNALNDLINGI